MQAPREIPGEYLKYQEKIVPREYNTKRNIKKKKNSYSHRAKIKFILKGRNKENLMKMLTSM